MGKWSGGGGCFGNLIDFETCNVGHGIVRSAMPGLTSNLSTRYNKLDDSVFLLCQNCGHSFKTDELKKMATYRGPTPTTRFRSTSKHFLTWSATAANHKLQKLSKNLVNNVSKLQSKFPFHHQNHSQQSQSQSTSSDNEDSSDWEPPCMNNGLGRNNNNSSNNGNSSSSANLMANDSLILNNNNNHNNNNVTSTTLLTNSTAITVNVNSSSAAVVKSNIRDPWNNRSNSGQNLNEKSALLVKNLVGVQVTNTFELRPVVTAADEGHQNQGYNNGSGSTVSMAGTTLPLTSPHWSPASSISSSTVGFSNSQPHAAAGSPNSNNINRLGHPHPKEALRLPLFSSRSSTGSNNSCRSPSPVDEDDDDHGLPAPTATSTPINNKLTVTIFEEEAEQLRQAPWFQAGIPREIALEVLRNEPIGSFIVRESTTKSGCFALSMRVPREFQPMGIAHYLILRTGRGYKIKGFTKEFQSLVSLITHHSVMPELLPCVLSLHRHHRSKYSRRRVNSSDFVEPEKLIPLRKFTDF